MLNEFLYIWKRHRLTSRQIFLSKITPKPVIGAKLNRFTSQVFVENTVPPWKVVGTLYLGIIYVTFKYFAFLECLNSQFVFIKLW